MKMLFPVLLLAALLCHTDLSAQAESSADEQAITQVVESLQQAWADKDGEAFAAAFADDHDFVVWMGLYFPNNDRMATAQNHQGIFNSVYRTVDVEYQVDKIRFVRPDVAVVHILGAAYEKGGDRPTYPTNLISCVMSKNDDRWEVASFHNLNIEYEMIFRATRPEETTPESYARVHYGNWYSGE